MTAIHPKNVKATGVMPAKMRKLMPFFGGAYREKSSYHGRARWVFLLSFCNN